MAIERVLAIREQIKLHERTISAVLDSVEPNWGGSIESEELMDAMVELADLKNELEFLLRSSAEPDEPGLALA